MRKNFYVFLDIDGVLWDWPFIKEEVAKGNLEKGCLEKQDGIFAFKPESVSALKTLLEILMETYDVNLVISSSWRSDMAQTINTLIKYDLFNVKKIEATRLTTHRIRGLEIKEYLKDKPDNDNYCIIDDEISDIISFVKKDSVIKTSLFDGALNIDQVKVHLEKLGLSKNENKMQEDLILE